MAAARKARRASGSRRRPLLKIAAGVIGVAALSGVIAYPYKSIVEAPSTVAEEVTARGPAQVVAIADMTAIKERVVNPALETEAVPVMPPVVAKPAAPTAGDPPPRPAARASLVEPPPPVVRETPPPEPPHIAAVAPRVEEVSRAPVDPWQPLRDALTSCSRVPGLWDRATCEQRARLASCDGHWGIVALCPAGRTEFGQ